MLVGEAAGRAVAGLCYDTAMTSRALILTLTLLLPACAGDPSDSTGSSTTQTGVDRQLGESCVIGVDLCELGTTCAKWGEDNGCNLGVCALDCEYDPLSPNAKDPCPVLDGNRTFCSGVTGHPIFIQACQWSCACPESYALECQFDLCYETNECGASSG